MYFCLFLRHFLTSFCLVTETYMVTGARVEAPVNHTRMIHGPALINKWHEILTGSRYLFRTCPRAFLLLFACNFHCLKLLSPLINHV